MVNIENMIIRNFDRENDNNILNEIKGNSKSNMIHQIEERLLTSRKVDSLEFDNAYLVDIDNKTVAYIYLSGKSKQVIYFECLILKEYRNKGLGKYILENISNYIFMNNEDLKEIKLSIDRSNIPSMKVAESVGYVCDDDYMNEKLDFIMDNPYYINYKK